MGLIHECAMKYVSNQLQPKPTSSPILFFSAPCVENIYTALKLRKVQVVYPCAAAFSWMRTNSQLTENVYA
jgi:hypothetical protein